MFLTLFSSISPVKAFLIWSSSDGANVSGRGNASNIDFTREDGDRSFIVRGTESPMSPFGLGLRLLVRLLLLLSILHRLRLLERLLRRWCSGYFLAVTKSSSSLALPALEELLLSVVLMFSWLS